MLHVRSTILAGLALLMAGATQVRADGDEKVKFADLPQAVKKTIKAKYPDAKIEGASKEKEDGETMYEVEMTIDGKSVDVVLDDKGEIEAVERTIPAEDLPRAVLNAARATFADATIDKVEEITGEGEVVVYELTLTLKGKATEVVMSPNGKILADDDDEKGEKAEKKEKPKSKSDDDRQPRKPNG